MRGRQSLLDALQLYGHKSLRELCYTPTIAELLGAAAHLIVCRKELGLSTPRLGQWHLPLVFLLLAVADGKHAVTAQFQLGCRVAQLFSKPILLMLVDLGHTEQGSAAVRIELLGELQARRRREVHHGRDHI